MSSAEIWVVSMSTATMEIGSRALACSSYSGGRRRRAESGSRAGRCGGASEKALSLWPKGRCSRAQPTIQRLNHPDPPP